MTLPSASIVEICFHISDFGT